MLSGSHLLIDGKNVLCRAIFAKSKDSPIELFYKIILNSATKAEATKFHIFWDCPRSKTWRRKLYHQYKENRKDKDPSVGEAIASCMAIIRELSPSLGFQQYYCNELEADDLIYAFSSVFHPTDIIVLSSDSDLSQIPFRFSNARQLRPAGEFLDRPTINPILQKSLTGDTSDNIDGYDGIGPSKSSKMLTSVTNLHEFISKSPFKFYFNLNLIDLSLCPYQMRAQKTILDGIQNEPKFDMAEARNIISKKNIYIPLHEIDWSQIRENIK